MAKAGRPKKPGGETTQIRLDADLVKVAKYLAPLTNQTPGDYLSAILRPILRREHAKAAASALDQGDKTK